MTLNTRVNCVPEEAVATRHLDYPETPVQIRVPDVASDYRAKPCAKEPWTYEWLKAIPNDGIMVDIGACVGSYALIAAARGLQVIAFEPVPWNYAECYVNMLINSFQDRMQIFPYAITAETGYAILNGPNVYSTGFGLYSSYRVFPDQIAIPVPTLALDDMPVDGRLHIKIDVEGAEADVIKGADQTLLQTDSLIVEIASDEFEEEITKALEAKGLHCRWRGGERTADIRTIWFERRKS